MILFAPWVKTHVTKLLVPSYVVYKISTKRDVINFVGTPQCLETQLAVKTTHKHVYFRTTFFCIQGFTLNNLEYIKNTIGI